MFHDFLCLQISGYFDNFTFGRYFLNQHNASNIANANFLAIISAIAHKFIQSIDFSKQIFTRLRQCLIRIATLPNTIV